MAVLRLLSLTMAFNNDNVDLSSKYCKDRSTAFKDIICYTHTHWHSHRHARTYRWRQPETPREQCILPNRYTGLGIFALAIEKQPLTISYLTEIVRRFNRHSYRYKRFPSSSFRWRHIRCPNILDWCRLVQLHPQVWQKHSLWCQHTFDIFVCL